MNVSVLFIDAPNPSSVRAVPQDISVVCVTARDALSAAQKLDCDQLLFLESQAFVGSQAFAVARSLNASGGILGGCAVDAVGTRRFGSVFASVPFGPYEVEPFPLIGAATDVAAQPRADAIDAVSPGAYLVDRRAFVEAGGFDPVLTTPWLACDLSARLRRLGKPVRWEPRFTFTLENLLASPQEAVDHKHFLRTWGDELAARFDVETPARGAVRRTTRLPQGQREVVTIPLPPTQIVLCGTGPLTPNRLRSSTRAHRLSVRDARGDGETGVAALYEAFRTRSDRYVAVVDAGAELEESWLERAIVDLESHPTIKCIRSGPVAVAALARVPLHLMPNPDAAGALDALTPLLVSETSPRSRLSLVYLTHVRTEYHRTSFEAVYGGELDIDYHVVATPSRPDTVSSLRGHATIDLIVDPSAGMAAGMNTALARAEGDIVVIIGDDFCPPPGWLDVIREAFALRPEMGVLGLSAVFVDGPQRIELAYPDVKAFQAVAASRRAARARDARLTDRLSALALAVDKRALAAVGGFDERLGAGRWAIEDFTLRLRAAGYAAYITEDLFVHRFLVDDAQPRVNDAAEEARRAKHFAEKWSVPVARVADFDPAPQIARGFDPDRLFVPIDASRIVERTLRERYDVVLVADCDDEKTLSEVRSALRRYLRAFRAKDPVLFALRVGGGLQLDAVGERVGAVVRKCNVALEDAPDIAILRGDAGEKSAQEVLPAGTRVALETLTDLSPGALRRLLR